jgi:chemotaxis protein CheD
VKKRIVVDISDAKISKDIDDILTTYSLGSCIGVSLYDVNAKIGGLFHYQLPTSSLDKPKAEKLPFMFADTGMALLLNKLVSMGVNKKRLQVKIAGGSNMTTGPKGFDIGKRNYLAIRKVLWQHGMFIDGEDIGGSSPRNMYLNMTDGSVTVRSVGKEKTI